MIARLLAAALAGALAVSALLTLTVPAESDQPFLRSPVLNSDGGRAFH